LRQWLNRLGLPTLFTKSLEVTPVDQFDGRIVGFHPFEGSSQGLISLLTDGFRGELLIYDLETSERQTIISRMGQFYRFGTTPDENVFYYRITDYCETELVTRVTGTHTGELDLTDFSMGIIPPTGKSFSMPLENAQVTIRDEKVTRYHVDPRPDAGILGMLAALGITAALV